MDHKCLQVLLIINFYIVLCASLPSSYKQLGGKENLFDKLFPGEERSVANDWSRDEHSMFAPSEERSKVQSIRGTELSVREKLLRDILDWEKRRVKQVKTNQGLNEKREPSRCPAGQTWCQNQRQMKRDFLRDMLNWDERRLEQVKQGQDVNEKREPQRCPAGQNWCHRETELKQDFLQDILDLNRKRLEQAEQSQGTHEKREPQRCWAGHMSCLGGDTSTEETENIIDEKISSDAQMDEMEIEKMKEYDMELDKALKKLQMKVPDALSNQM